MCHLNQDIPEKLDLIKHAKSVRLRLLNDTDSCDGRISSPWLILMVIDGDDGDDDVKKSFQDFNHVKDRSEPKAKGKHAKKDRTRNKMLKGDPIPCCF